MRPNAADGLTRAATDIYWRRIQSRVAAPAAQEPKIVRKLLLLFALVAIAALARRLDAPVLICDPAFQRLERAVRVKWLAT